MEPKVRSCEKSDPLEFQLTYDMLRDSHSRKNFDIVVQKDANHICFRSGFSALKHEIRILNSVRLSQKCFADTSDNSFAIKYN